MRAVFEVGLGDQRVQPADSRIERIGVSEIIHTNKDAIFSVNIPVASHVQELRVLYGRGSAELRRRNSNGFQGRLVCGAHRVRHGQRAVQVLVRAEDEKLVPLDRSARVHAVGIH